jgi:hypothetical protein
MAAPNTPIPGWTPPGQNPALNPAASPVLPQAAQQVTPQPTAQAASKPAQKKAAKVVAAPEKNRDMSRYVATPQQPQGMIKAGNIDLAKRPIVKNKDGSYSTVRSITIQTDQGYVLIPTVVGRKVVSNKAAIAHFAKTGEHLGVFDSEQDADTYASQLHDQQAQAYGAKAQGEIKNSDVTKPTLPVLQQYGLSMNIDQLNQNVNSMVGAFLKKNGYNPSPALIFDVLKAQGLTGPINYDELFGVPTSPKQAKIDAVARSFATQSVGDKNLLGDYPILEPSALDLVKGMKQAIGMDSKRLNTSQPFEHGIGAQDSMSTFSQFLNVNRDQINQALKDPKQSKVIVRALVNYLPNDLTRYVTPEALNAERVAKITGKPITAGQTRRVKLLEAHQILAEGIPVNLNLVAKTSTQILAATTNMPFGYYKMVKAVGMDTYDLSTVPLSALGAPVKNRGDQATRTITMLHQMGDQIIFQDVAHPLRNPGYLLMDIWGAATAAGGVVGKLGAVGRAGREEGVLAAGKALVSKTPPEWTDMGVPGRTGAHAYHEALPLSDTTIVRVIQKHFPVVGRVARQKALDGFDTDAHSLVPNIVSTEKMLARAKSASMQIEYAVALTPIVEMTRLARADQWARDVFKETALKGKIHQWRDVSLKHRLGAQKAMQVIMTDDPDPINMWRSFHERQLGELIDATKKYTYNAARKTVQESGGETKLLEAIDQVKKSREHKQTLGELRYSIAAHQSQLEALELAQQIITNPTDRFRGMLDSAYEASAAQQAMKSQVSGLDEERMAQHVAEIAGFARGENIIDLGEGFKGVSSEDPGVVKQLSEDVERTQNKLKNAQQRLNYARRTSRVTAGMEAEVARHERAVMRHEARMKTLTKRMQKIQDAAAPLTRQMVDETSPVVDEDIAALRAGRGSAYSGPTQPERYRGQRRIRDFIRPNSRFGVRPPELNLNTWTGKSLEMGDFRWDVSELLGEQMKIAFRAAKHYEQHQSLWAIGKDAPTSDFDQPIRDIKTIPDAQRTFVTSMERAKLGGRFADIATESTMDEMRKFLFPTMDEVRDGVVPSKHVRYVDERLILDHMGRVPTQFWQILDHGLNSTMGIINEPARILLIFATPAYALNALGSAALLMIDEGPMAPINLARAMLAEKAYGPQATRLIDRLAGETHAASLYTEKAWYTKGSGAMMNAWARMTDTYFRRASVIGHLKRHGLLKNDWADHDAHLAELQDSANATKVNMAAQSGRKAMLDFQSMSWPERATMRHLFFVYAFVRASSIWSLRFLRDHGAMSDALAQAGRDRQQNIDQLVGKMPDWFMREGYFGVHPGTIYNPIQWNMPGMLAQTVYPLTSIFGHTPYANPSDLLGPAADIAISTMTGVNQNGEALPHSSTLAKVPLLGGSFGDSILAQWQTTPLGQIGVKHTKSANQKPLKPPQVHASFENPLTAAMASERSGLNQSVFDNDGFWNTWGLALFRSGITRDVNSVAGQARYWRDVRDNDPQAYHKHEIQAVNQMLQRQSKVIGEPVPGAVTRAVDAIAQVSQAIEDYKTKHKGTPTPNDMQINQITLDSLAQQGLITNKAKWQKQIANDHTQTDMSATRVQLLYAAGGEAWKNWVDRVNAVDAYAQPKYASNVGNMAAIGLGDYTASAAAPQANKWAYGRKSLAIMAQAKELAGRYAAQTGDQAAITRQEWVQYVNDNDKPITIGGVKYPSPFQYDFASKSSKEQEAALAVYAKRPTDELTAFQTQLLTGKRPDPIVSKGWQTLSEWMQSAGKQTPLGQSVPSGERKFYEDYLASKSKPFNDALQFSRQPLAERMKTYLPVKNSDHADAWTWTLNTVTQRLDELNKTFVNSAGNPDKATVHRYWVDHDVPILLNQIKSKYGAGFTSELALYTGATGNGDGDAYLDKFLGRLISP